MTQKHFFIHATDGTEKVRIEPCGGGCRVVLDAGFSDEREGVIIDFASRDDVHNWLLRAYSALQEYDIEAAYMGGERAE